MKPSYRDPKRKVGSQKETPTVTFTQGVATIGGYQNYRLTNKCGVTCLGNYRGKFKYIDSFLQNSDSDTVLDLGASNGLVSFLASKYAKQISALDHDTECVSLIQKLIKFTNVKNVTAKQWSFGDPVEPADTVIVGALIHWVFSCTANYGNFTDIIDYLDGLTLKNLLIEWVDPKDRAIQSFKHTAGNPAYCLENFQSALKTKFKNVTKVYSVTATRSLWLATKL